MDLHIPKVGAIELDLCFSIDCTQIEKMVKAPLPRSIHTSTVRARLARHDPKIIDSALHSLLDWLHGDGNRAEQANSSQQSTSSSHNHEQPHRTLEIDVCQPKWRRHMWAMSSAGNFVGDIVKV